MLSHRYAVTTSRYSVSTVVRPAHSIPSLLGVINGSSAVADHRPNKSSYQGSRSSRSDNDRRLEIREVSTAAVAKALTASHAQTQPSSGTNGRSDQRKPPALA